MRRKNTKTCSLALFAILLLSTSAWALPTAGTTVTISDGLYGSSNGGEFNLDIGNDDNSANDYISFCVELHEYIDYVTTYTIQSVSDNVTSGGGDSDTTTIGYDTISSATQWVVYTYFYGSFVNKNDSNDTLSRGSDDLANYVQYVIWFLEDEITANTNSDWYQFYEDYVLGQTSSKYDAYVTVLNLVDRWGNNAQSQIIADQMPDPVPEPTTMLLFGTGLVGLAGITRRRVNR